MKTRLLTFLTLWLLPWMATAHVGSPNVFFEGHAGAIPVRVIIRPPATLPGIAQVDVRVDDPTVTRVTANAVFADAGAEAPAPTTATAVNGDDHLYNAALWLVRRGAFRIEITVESPRSRGTVVVPLDSAATQRPEMPPALGVFLAILGITLSAGAVTLAGAAAREGTIEAGTPAAKTDLSRGNRVALGFALLLAGALYGGAVRWQRMDREFRTNALAQPVPVSASIRTDGTLHRLILTPPTETPGSLDWDALVADHGKLMHLFLLRAPNFEAFAHIHPARRDARTFEAVLPPLPGGDYHLYAELTYETGLTQTLVGRVALPQPLGLASQAGWTMLDDVWCQSPLATASTSAQPDALEVDDSWHVSPAAAAPTRVSPLMGGSRMVFQNAGPLVANQETSLRFAVAGASGEAIPLQPYMGMLGHAVIRRADGEVFTHLHPVGSISMAAQALVSPPAATPVAMAGNAATPESEVTFPYAFPRPGNYRMWVQVRLAGRVVSGVFDLTVAPES